MRHRKFTFKIGRTSAHRKAMLANMVCSLFEERRIRTTVTKAKQARRLAERMITLGKRGRDHDRRRAASILRQPHVVAALFTDIAPRLQERQGGYTRILKTGPRTGDAAEMCILELIFEPVVPKDEKRRGAEETMVPADAAAADADTEGAEGSVPEEPATASAEEREAESSSDTSTEPAEDSQPASEKS